jgi:hypothetical protein
MWQFSGVHPLHIMKVTNTYVYIYVCVCVCVYHHQPLVTVASALTEIWTRHLSGASPEHYFCASLFSLQPTLPPHITHSYKDFSVSRNFKFLDYAATIKLTKNLFSRRKNVAAKSMSQDSSLLKWKPALFLEAKILLGLIFLINMIQNPQVWDCRSPIAFSDSS